MQKKIVLKMQTTDQKKIELANAYWSQNSDNSWCLDPEQVAKQFSISSNRIPSILSSVCEATHPDLTCSGDECNAPRKLTSRSNFLKCLNDVRLKERRLRATFLCTKCQKLESGHLLAIEKEREEVATEKIRGWLTESTLKFHPKFYEDCPLRDAFFIDGLLRSAGDAWNGAQLDSWIAYQPHLCAVDEEATDVYKHLYFNGWITPDANSPLDAFYIVDDEAVSFDFLRVRWLLAEDAFGAPHTQIIEITRKILSTAQSNEYLDLWRWTCLRELHAHFNYCQSIKPIGQTSWTAEIEQKLSKVLEVHSLAEAKSIIYFCFDNIKTDLKDKKTVKPYSANQLANYFLSMSNRFHTMGRGVCVLKPHVLLGTTAIYTSHLFVHVFGGGDELYLTLTGIKLKNLNQGSKGAITLSKNA